MKTKKEFSAGGIVFKKQRNKTLWLVVQHSQHKGWVFPKGLIGDKKENEKMEEAALREVEEEGGVKTKIVHNKPIKVNYMYRFDEFLVKKTVYYFLMEYISGNPKDHDWEISDAKFLTKDEVEEILTYQSDKKAFNKILKIFKRNY